MSDKTRDINFYARSLSVMAVIGWFADTMGSLALHRGWWVLLPVFNTACTVFLAIRLRQALNRA